MTAYSRLIKLEALRCRTSPRRSPKKYKMDEPSTNWGKFSMQLLGLLRQIPTCEPQDAPSLDLARMTSEEIDFRLEELEAPVSEAIDAAIRAWPDDAEVWASLCGLELYFLRMRVETSFQFVVQFVHCGDHPETSFFDFPEHSSRSDIARFLLIDWWRTHGRMSAVMDLLVTHHDSIRQE